MLYTFRPHILKQIKYQPIQGLKRFYSLPTSNPSGSGAFQVFDREAKRKQKDRAASNKEQSRLVDYLKDEVAARVADRLLVINKKEILLIKLLEFNRKKKIESAKKKNRV